ncbi:unnamed protein product [Microthlaspi erraticum]|uniref:Uncharacterized protein n=1 Tax=Microthlaspi erraticum TaxID=1685480 RepID=A0A6D2HYF2_9BRAS|nr:unnamed protein product [Microthlaspi erraticum]
MPSSSGRTSSHSSNPSTPTSNLRPLPIQYAHSQTSAPPPPPRGSAPPPPPRGSAPQPTPRGSAPQPTPRGSAPQPQPLGFTPQPSASGTAPQPQPFRPQPLRPQPYVPPTFSPPAYAQSPVHMETDDEPPENYPLPEEPQAPQQDPPISIYDLLRTPGREAYLPILDPCHTENTTWFDRDDGKLVRKISKILKSKFDGAYYCWTKTPKHVQERCFIAFAQAHHWDPLINSLVEDEFKAIALLRMKDMVCKAKKKGARPNWIGETLWRTMCSYWATEEAKERSCTASNAVNFFRKMDWEGAYIGQDKSPIRGSKEIW